MKGFLKMQSVVQLTIALCAIMRLGSSLLGQSFTGTGNSFPPTAKIAGGIGRNFMPRRKYSRSFQSSSTSDSNSEPLWKEQVEYVDLTAVNEQAPVGGAALRSLPLFLLDNPFFPEGTTYLNVFEMKYRTMMFDIAQGDDCFGYIMSDRGGGISSVGTICKVVQRELLEDGRQFLAVRGIGRFRVKKILKTLPYVLAEVETDITDLDTTGDDKAEARATTLELETYCMLKYYMRLMRSVEVNSKMVVSQAVKKNRPMFSAATSATTTTTTAATAAIATTATNEMEFENASKGVIPTGSSSSSSGTDSRSSDGFIRTGGSTNTISSSGSNGNNNNTGNQPHSDNSARRSAFSFSIASMIQMTQPREAQLVLQTRSVIKRLTAQRDILYQACELIAQQLIKAQVLTAGKRDEIRATCFVKSATPPSLIKSAEEADTDASSSSSSSVSSEVNNLTPMLLDDDSDILPEDVIESDQGEEKDEWDLSNIE